MFTDCDLDLDPHFRWSFNTLVRCAANSHKIVEDFEAKVDAKLAGTIPALAPITGQDPVAGSDPITSLNPFAG